MLSIYDRAALLPKFETYEWLTGVPFTVIPIGEVQVAWGGVYLAVQRIDGLLGPGWLPWYAGKTACFGDRICDSHHKLPTAIQRGATHLHLLRVEEPRRSDIERQLVARYAPALNDRLPPAGTRGLLDGMIKWR